MEFSPVALEKLEAFGFVEIDGVQSIQSALDLTSQLGPVRSLNGSIIQTLKPMSQNRATSPSFSRAYGHGRFPLHTDTSFWKVPARYMVSYMREASSTATVVLPSFLTRELLVRYKRLNPIFSRSTTAGVSYSPPWFGSDSEFIVFDTCYMKPANRAAVEFHEAIEARFEDSIDTLWKGSKMLIVDNWRAAHGRQKAGDEDRILHRFYRG